MLSRRTFLEAAVGAVASKLCGNGHNAVAQATEAAEHAEISGLRVIRLREKGGSKIRSYLEITTDLGARGISGELFQDTPQMFEELMPGLSKALVGRNPNQQQLGTVWIWNKLYTDHPLDVFAEGVDPLTRQKIWGNSPPASPYDNWHGYDGDQCRRQRYLGSSGQARGQAGS